jgi:hypothetical protein
MVMAPSAQMGLFSLDAWQMADGRQQTDKQLDIGSRNIRANHHFF